MPKKREDPMQWMPETGLPDTECTILEYWSRYCKKIAIFRSFRRMDTICEYTASLKKIEAALGPQKLVQMSACDVWDAATSVLMRTTATGETRLYNSNTILKRFSAIHDIFLYAEACGVCVCPLRCPPWKLLGDQFPDFFLNSNDIINELAEKYPRKILPRYFTKKQEQALVREILDHIHEDGRWLGIAILLWCGVRPSELRRLYFSDFVTFYDRTDRRYICFCRSADAKGQEKSHMKNKYGPRAIPEHIELMHIARLREDHVRNAMGSTDISGLPAVCYGNDYTRACSASELAIFVKTQLEKVLGKEYMTDIDIANHIDPDIAGDGIDGDVPNNLADLAADKEISVRMFRRNFATKNYAETGLADWASRLAMGHMQAGPIAVTSPYGEAHLLEMLEAMDHRMILPEIHPGWHTVCTGGTKTIPMANAGTHYISIPEAELHHIRKICIDVEMCASGAGFKLETLRKYPEAIKITAEYIPTTGSSGARTNADSVQWPLSWVLAKKDLEKKYG